MSKPIPKLPIGAFSDDIARMTMRKLRSRKDGEGTNDDAKPETQYSKSRAKLAASLKEKLLYGGGGAAAAAAAATLGDDALTLIRRGLTFGRRSMALSENIAHAQQQAVEGAPAPVEEKPQVAR